MSIKYLISFKSGDKKLVDRHFRLNVSNNEDVDMDASILLHLKYEDDEIEKIYG